MIEVKERPANDTVFDSLKIFGKEVLDLLKDKGIGPLAYGSLALFGHLKNSELEVKDFNFLIPDVELSTVVKLAKDAAIDYEYFPEWHSVHLKDGDAEITLDSLEFWAKGLTLKYVEFNFSGFKTKALGLDSLRKVYERSAVENVEDSRKHHNKLAMFDER